MIVLFVISLLFPLRLFPCKLVFTENIDISLYARKIGMEIKTDKAKIVNFKKTGKFFRRTFNFYNENLFTTNS